MKEAHFHPLVVQIVMEHVLTFLNVIMFNEIISHADLCTGEIGFNTKLVLSYLNTWASSYDSLSDSSLLALTQQCMRPLSEVADALVVLPNGAKEEFDTSEELHA